MRYVLVDFTHLAYKTFVAEPLSAMVNINGELQKVDTTVPNYTIKGIFNYSGRGMFHTAVFFEGGSQYRKDYFAEIRRFLERNQTTVRQNTQKYGKIIVKTIQNDIQTEIIVAIIRKYKAIIMKNR